MTARIRVLLAHPGTQYGGQLANQLERHGYLGEFHTGLALSRNSWLSRILESIPAVKEKMGARQLSGVSSDRLHSYPRGELWALWRLRRGGRSEQILSQRNAAFQSAIPDAAFSRNNVVVGFDTSSWIISKRARDHNRMFVLDQSIGHARSFLPIAEKLQALYPEWSSQLDIKTEEAFGREKVEQTNAAKIVVPSRFVAATLEENAIDLRKVIVNPFGVDLDCFVPAPQPVTPDPLRFVFAGALQARKGVPLLLNTWRSIQTNRRIELWVIGGGKLPASVRNTLPDKVRVMGRMTKEHLAAALRECHVFVFPSYFEGLAQAQIEAAACGLPVIGTTSSGCEEIIKDKETGLVLETGNGEQLRSALLAFIDDPELALRMRLRLLEEREQWSWDRYGDRWMKFLHGIEPDLSLNKADVA